MKKKIQIHIVFDFHNRIFSIKSICLSLKMYNILKIIIVFGEYVLLTFYDVKLLVLLKLSIQMAEF